MPSDTRSASTTTVNPPNEVLRVNNSVNLLSGRSHARMLVTSSLRVLCFLFSFCLCHFVDPTKQAKRADSRKGARARVSCSCIRRCSFIYIQSEPSVRLSDDACSVRGRGERQRFKSIQSCFRRPARRPAKVPLRPCLPHEVS